MPNYNLLFSVSEVANILNVDRDIIKTWALNFSEYVSAKANPPKGTPRVFCSTDISVFAYIFYYWEEEPDIESIKWGLNANEQMEYPFNEILPEITPIFIDPPEDLDENSLGNIFGGMSEFGDIFYLANSYKLAGDVIVDSAIANRGQYEILCPAIYNYRHATELYLKATIGKTKKEHNLIPLLEKFKNLVKKEFNSDVPFWFEDIIISINDFDPFGTTFRYGGSIPNDEVYVDLRHVKKKMDSLSTTFQTIKKYRQ